MLHIVGVWSCGGIYKHNSECGVAWECCIFGVSESQWCETTIVSDRLCYWKLATYIQCHVAHFFVYSLIVEHVRWFLGGVAVVLFFQWFLDLVGLACCGGNINSCVFEMMVCNGALFFCYDA
jgi:hypothetical protein